MIIGLISDTHDNVPNILKAKEIFKENKVSLVIHSGDVVAPKTVTFFEGLNVWFIKGNADGDTEKIKLFAEKQGGKYLGELAEFDIENKKFCVYHGTDPDKLRNLALSQKYDYVITGHTHEPYKIKEGKTLIINPGAHYYMSSNTIAILDTKNSSVRFIDVTNNNPLNI
jgi:putative phosphoesterase